MRFALFFLQILFVSLSSMEQSRSFALLHVNVIDISSGKIEEDMNVKISGHKIVSITQGKGDFTNCKLIDAKGKYLIPGLWDMHAHIRGKENIFFPLLIANGVTGIRDPHNPKRCFTAGKWRDSINNSNMIAPRIGAVAGCIVDGPGDGRNYGFLEVKTEEEARQIVDSLKHSGADFIKVYEHLPPNIYAAIAEEAKKQHIPFAGHIPLFMRAIDCAAAGQKSFEHLENFHQYCSTQELKIVRAYLDSFPLMKDSDFIRLSQFAYDTFDPAIAVSFCNKLKELGTQVDPTLVVDMPDRCRKELETKNVLSKKNIPAAISSWFENKKEASIEDDLSARLFWRQLEILGYLNRAKVNLIAGTDMSDIHRLVPGYSIHDELELYVEAGLTPLEALKTATINPAIFLNKQNELGSVEAGKLADLILLDANPLNDIKNINRIFAVIQNGHYINKNTLDNMLAQAVKNILARNN